MAVVSGMHRRAAMRRVGVLVVVSVLTLCGCFPDFTEADIADFKTTLSRLSHRWTPAEAIALGSTFSVEMSPHCLFCAPLRLDGGVNWTGNQQVLAGVPSGFMAVGEGTQRVEYRGTDGFTFQVRVEAPASLSIHDPLVLSRELFSYLRTTDGGTWPEFPDVGEEIVMGADAGLLLDIFAHGGDGAFLGSSAIFAAGSDGGEVPATTFLDDGRLIDLSSGPGGRGNVSVMLRDGGLERSWPVRVAGADEVAKLELVAVPVAEKFLVRALATRGDGGAFLEPPVEWEFSRGVVPDSYWGTSGWPARERREVRFLSGVIADGGVITVSARVGSASTSIDLEFQDRPPPPPPSPSPPKPVGCGCASVEPSALLLFLGLMFARRTPRAG